MLYSQIDFISALMSEIINKLWNISTDGSESLVFFDGTWNREMFNPITYICAGKFLLFLYRLWRVMMLGAFLRKLRKRRCVANVYTDASPWYLTGNELWNFQWHCYQWNAFWKNCLCILVPEKKTCKTMLIVCNQFFSSESTKERPFSLEIRCVIFSPWSPAGAIVNLQMELDSRLLIQSVFVKIIYAV